MLLWENGAPGALGNDEADKPALTLYPAFGSNISTTAVIICPGGGYGALAMNHEGRQVANWFNSRFESERHVWKSWRCRTRLADCALATPSA